MTASDDYQGGGFTASRWIGTGSREIGFMTLTMGSSTLVQSGRAGLWGIRFNTGLRAYETFDIGYNASAGVVDLARGNYASGSLRLLSGAISAPGALGKGLNINRFLRTGPIAHSGASLMNLTTAEIRRIQNAANRTGYDIILVGSRAKGTAGSLSDWDYIVPGANRSVRHSLKSSLPSGTPLGLGQPSRIDFLPGPFAH